jgi:hypothetical protein
VVPFDQHIPTDALARLKELIALGRRYETFAQMNRAEADAHITELNAPGLKENAWDLTWLPATLRPRVARVSSVIVLDVCGRPGDPQHEASLMDAIMPAAIIAACVVAHAYGAAPTAPAGQRGPLATFAALLRRITIENPDELRTLALRPDAASPAEFPIVACLPLKIRDRLIGLTQVMGRLPHPLRLKIVTVILTIGAVVADKFEPLALGDPMSQPSTHAREPKAADS